MTFQANVEAEVLLIYWMNIDRLLRTTVKEAKLRADYAVNERLISGVTRSSKITTLATSTAAS